MGLRVAGDQGRVMMAEGPLEKGNGFAHIDSRFGTTFQAERAESRPDGWKTQECRGRVWQGTRCVKGVIGHKFQRVSWDSIMEGLELC